MWSRRAAMSAIGLRVTLPMTGVTSLAGMPELCKCCIAASQLVRGSILNPAPEHLANKRILSVVQVQQVLEYEHIAFAEVARWTMPQDVPLRRVVLDGVASTVSLKSAITA